MPDTRQSEAMAKTGFEEDVRKFMSEMRTSFKDLSKKVSNIEVNIDKKLKAIDDKFSGFYSELKDDMSNIKTEVEEATSDVENLKSQVEGIERSIDFHSSKVESVERNLDSKRENLKEDLEEKIKQLDRKLLMLEKHERKYNLIFYGVGEDENERLYDKIRNVLKENFKVNEERVEKIHFANGHRLPADPNFNGPKPIIMRFSAYEDRELVMSHAYKLAGTGIKVLTDLPVTMKKERGRLAKQAYDIRQKEKLKTRIREKGLTLVLEVRRDGSDRWKERKV